MPIAKFVEVIHQNAAGGFSNWGKFQLETYTKEEWGYLSRVQPPEMSMGLLRACGWGESIIWVKDLQTGEGACFTPRGNARADLRKHKIWVCPMFEPFLVWLYSHPEYHRDITQVPDRVELSYDEAPPESRGYRRPGPQGVEK